MTWSEWEKRFFKGLTSLSDDERLEIVAYYREMYGDKLEAGISEAEILAEFGEPELCARKILEEGTETTVSDKENETPQKEVDAPLPPPIVSEAPSAPKKEDVNAAQSGESVASVVGMVVLTLLLILPLAIVALAVIISFGAACVSGGVAALAGLVYIFFLPFAGLTGAGVVANIGIGIATIGVGILLFVGFWYLTKYTAIGTYKVLVSIYGRRKRQ